MKITIFARKKAWHVNQIINEARKKNIKTDLLCLKSLGQYNKISKKIADVVIWRSSFLNSIDEKIVQTEINDRPLINSSHIKYSFLAKKIFQQKYLEKYKSINCIPSYIFNNALELQKGIGKEINFPVIQKPNVGTQGNGIILAKSLTDIKKNKSSLKEFIFQPFIENDGDYRVLVLGGKVLGIIKRTAKKGSFLNNISQGGYAKHITDEKLTKPLSEIALKVASIFELSFCGIDIIFNKKNNRYYFLELNTLPEWKGFQKATKINVAREIINYCISLSERNKLKTPTLVKNYFEKNYPFLEKQKFHYSSRMFLWTKKSLYKKRLDELNNQYLGKDENESREIFKKTLRFNKINEKNLLRNYIRKPYLKKYPSLTPYNAALFKSLFAETLYGKDIRTLLKKFLNKDDLLKLKVRLEKDNLAIATLSTLAVNFIYNLSHYLKTPYLADPNLFLRIAQKSYTGKLKHYTDLKLYLLTHAIIGESKFYSRKITRHKKVYLQMIKLCENLIQRNYFSIPLDNKFEFLVCIKLLNYKSIVEKMILDEADRSLSSIGNFLVGQLNDSKTVLSQNIIDAEHRNVLFIMADSKYTN
jgi:RimK family alpha-L-glutamate ligase